VLANLGYLFHYLGNNQAARDMSERALHIAEDAGARSCQGVALTVLGHTLLESGQLEEATAAYQQALSLQRELGENRPALGALAGLCRVALAQSDLAMSRGYMDEILAHLEEYGELNGTADPFRVYLTGYQCLSANHDQRAHDMLTQAYAVLQAQAANLEDQATRDSFLTNVPAHRELIAVWASVTMAKS
jgi:tetratricopeptide (TPR) repeat protein